MRGVEIILCGSPPNSPWVKKCFGSHLNHELPNQLQRVCVHLYWFHELPINLREHAFTFVVGLDFPL